MRTSRTCDVAGCDQPHKARGLCPTHYSRYRRTGDVSAETPLQRRTCGRRRCDQRHHRQGLCQAHYHQWVASGAIREPLDITQCAQLYQDGASAATLAHRFGYTPRAILDALRAAGTAIRPPRRRRSTRTR